MHLTFAKKVVIVTGGTRGIGASMVKEFHKSGAKVIATGTKQHEIDELNSLNEKIGVKYFQLDFLSNESINQFLKAVSKLDQIDALINNAGINKIDSIDKISEIDWERVNDVNLRGPFILTRTISERLKQQKCGRIINIASIFGVVSKEKRAAYSSTKWGLIGFTKAVALDLAPFNVLVNSVSPGFVDTELTRRIIGPENIKKLIETIPQKRLANPDEIAKVVMFLCSDLNTYITGQNIVVDGGFTSA